MSASAAMRAAASCRVNEATPEVMALLSVRYDRAVLDNHLRLADFFAGLRKDGKVTVEALVGVGDGLFVRARPHSHNVLVAERKDNWRSKRALKRLRAASLSHHFVRAVVHLGSRRRLLGGSLGGGLRRRRLGGGGRRA